MQVSSLYVSKRRRQAMPTVDAGIDVAQAIGWLASICWNGRDPYFFVQEGTGGLPEGMVVVNLPVVFDW